MRRTPKTSTHMSGDSKPPSRGKLWPESPPKLPRSRSRTPPPARLKPAFTFGFWHRFGLLGGESADAILARKQNEIDACGWTLWSFQHRLMLDAWAREIRRADLAA